MNTTDIKRLRLWKFEHPILDLTVLTVPTNAFSFWNLWLNGKLSSPLKQLKEAKCVLTMQDDDIV